MKERLLRLINIGLFAMATLVLATLQTSFWFQIMGYFPAPALWVPVLVYIALFRSAVEAVIAIYVNALILSTMTAIPDGMLLMICLLLGVTVQLFKQRIFWTSASYFMMICGVTALLFHVYHYTVSAAMEDPAMSSPEISEWLIEALLTPLAAPFLYKVFWWFDRITQREQPVEVGSQLF